MDPILLKILDYIESYQGDRDEQRPTGEVEAARDEDNAVDLAKAKGGVRENALEMEEEEYEEIIFALLDNRLRESKLASL